MGTEQPPLGEGENDELLVECEAHGDYDARFGADCPICNQEAEREFEQLVPGPGWANAEVPF